MYFLRFFATKEGASFIKRAKPSHSFYLFQIKLLDKMKGKEKKEKHQVKFLITWSES
jgi:hypothetical protein